MLSLQPAFPQEKEVDLKADIGQLFVTYFSLNLPTWLIQSLSHDVRDSCVCVSVCAMAENTVDWRPLVEESSTINIGIHLEVFLFLLFQ